MSMLTNPLPSYAYPLLALFLVLFFSWRGYKHGLIREITGVLSLIASILLAKPFGIPFLPLLSETAIPRALHTMIAMAIGATLAYVLTRISLSLLSKHFDHSSDNSKEREKGKGMRIGGACIGGAFGVVLVFLLSWYILSVGKISHIMLRNVPEHTASQGIEEGQELVSEKDSLLLLPAKITAAHREGLAQSILGAIAEETNPVPEQVFQGTEIIMEAMQNPASLEKIVEYEPVMELMEMKSVQDLLNNDDIRELAAEGNIMELLKHPAIKEIADNPAIQTSLQKIDIEEVMQLLENQE